MVENVLDIPGEIMTVIAATVILGLFSILAVLRTRMKTLPGSKGYREKQGEAREGSEFIRADGYIDSFAGEVEEAGGSLPPLIVVAIPGIILWWLGYLILNWNPR